MTDAAKTVDVIVRATAPGFCLGRRRVGDEFAYTARIVEGKPKLPSWVQAVPEEELIARLVEADAEAKAKPKHKPAPKVKEQTLAEAAKEAGHTSPNMPSDKKGTLTLSKGGQQTGADLA